VATDLTGVSARAMLEALVAGERDPKVLADLAKRSLRHKIPALIEALQGRFTEHHAFMVSQYLAQLDTQQATIDALTARIDTVIAPFAEARDALVTTPGISQTVADVIIAETGADMTVFPTAAHLASWAGVCPGLNESAGRVKSAHTRHGNAHLKAALGVAAMSASRTNNTYLAARYRRIATRRGPVRAVVAIERTILTAVWNMLTHHTTYTDLGGDYYTRRDPMRAKHKAIRQLEALGYQVTVQPAAP
jgi:transposase